ncbi:hypothetical protein BKX96_28045 [Pseudomonas putida]|nr:hypothetical protein BKX96_28045 [Pseudomonas putida]
MIVNDDAGNLTPRGALRFFASRLAPTGISLARALALALALALLWLLLLIYLPHFQRPNAGVAQWASRHGCRDSRPRPWMADGVGPTEQCRSEGTPSPSEGPKWWGKTFGSFGAFAKGTRRKGETLGGRYRRNGYVLHQQIIGRL